MPRDLDPSVLCSVKNCGTLLVVQWIRIQLLMQGTQVQSLIQEDPTCRGRVTKPVGHK